MGLSKITNQYQIAKQQGEETERHCDKNSKMAYDPASRIPLRPALQTL